MAYDFPTSGSPLTYDDTPLGKIMERVITELEIIREILDRYAPQRRDPPLYVLAQHVQTCIRAFQGKCPCCERVVIIVSRERLQGESQLDHWFNRSASKPHETWLICKDCHSKFSRGIWTREERQRYFSAYQVRRENLYPEERQPTIFDQAPVHITVPNAPTARIAANDNQYWVRPGEMVLPTHLSAELQAKIRS